MKKNILIFGSISGLVSAALMFLSLMISNGSHDFENGMLYGYGSMIIAFSFIFVGVKNYRDKFNNGVIRFGPAFKMGLLITLIGSTIYVIAWAFEYHFFLPSFMDEYASQMIEQAKKEGMTGQKLAAKIAEMDEAKAMYKNPFMFTLFTYAEIVPVGLIISLIAALILKKKPTQPQTQL